MQRVFTLNLFQGLPCLEFILDKNSGFLTYHIGLNRVIAYSSEISNIISANLKGADGLAPLINLLDSEQYFNFVSAIENRIDSEIILTIKNTSYRCNLNFSGFNLTIFLNKISQQNYQSVLDELQNSLENFTSKLPLDSRSLTAQTNHLIGLVGILNNSVQPKIKYSLDVFLANLFSLSEIDINELNLQTNFSLELEPQALSLMISNINKSTNVNLIIADENLVINLEHPHNLEYKSYGITFSKNQFVIPLIKNRYNGTIYIYDENLVSKEIFESFNYQTEFFSNQKQLLKALINLEPDLVLINPPLFTGTKLVKQVKAIVNCQVFGILETNQFKSDSSIKELDKIYAKPLNFSLIKKILTSDINLTTSYNEREIA